MRSPERPKERGYADLFSGAFSPGRGSGSRTHEIPTIPRTVAGGQSPSENRSLPTLPAGSRIRKSAQKGCSFTQNFGIRQDCPRIAVFLGKSRFSKTLIYAFGRQISLRIGLGYLKMKRRPVLGVSKRCRSCYYFCSVENLFHDILLPPLRQPCPRWGRGRM